MPSLCSLDLSGVLRPHDGSGSLLCNPLLSCRNSRVRYDRNRPFGFSCFISCAQRRHSAWGFVGLVTTQIHEVRSPGLDGGRSIPLAQLHQGHGPPPKSPVVSPTDRVLTAVGLCQHG